MNLLNKKYKLQTLDKQTLMLYNNAVNKAELFSRSHRHDFCLLCGQ